MFMTEKDLRDILLAVLNDPLDFVSEIYKDEIVCSHYKRNYFVIYYACSGNCMGIQSNGVRWEIDLTPDIKEEYLKYFEDIKKEYEEQYFRELYNDIIE
jgi:hypothetical protein